MQSEPKPCPICGASASWETALTANIGGVEYIYGSCSECSCQADYHDWNTRPATDAAPEEPWEGPLTEEETAMIDAAWEKHKAAGPACDIPPPGWYCTRGRGHDGPCAAHATDAVLSELYDGSVQLPTDAAPDRLVEAAKAMRETARELRDNPGRDCNSVMQAIMWEKRAEKVEARITALEAELAERDATIARLREDAARYRWLRDHSCPPHNFYISVPDEFHGIRYAPSEVDAYIDEASKALRTVDGEAG